MKIKKLIPYITAFSLVFATASLKNKISTSGEINEFIEQTLAEGNYDDFEITAHRGFSSKEIENTKEAIIMAAEEDYIDRIEMDIRLTKDNKIILSHDNVLKKSFGHEILSDITYEEALKTPFIYRNLIPQKALTNDIESVFLLQRKLSLYGKQYHLIGLEEGIESCGNKKILLDLKFHNDKETFVQELKKELKDIDTSQILFQSLDLDGIKYLQDNSEFKCMGLISSRKDFDRMKEFDRIAIRYSLITYDVVDQLLKEGKEVSIWTINDGTTLNSVTNILQDHIQDVNYITDNPDLIMAYLLQKKQKQLIK